MPNNFFLTGAAYTSKAGSDSNNGTTKDTPKATLNAAVALNLVGDVVVGAGSYSESIVATTAITGIRGDGDVLFYGDSTMEFTISVSTGIFAVSNITFNGYRAISARFNGNGRDFVNCKFYNISAFNPQGFGVFTNCIFVNCTWAGTNASRYTFDQCIFINCTIRDCSKMTNCYMNGVSTVRTIAGITAANFDGNNIMGANAIAVSDTNYLSLTAHKAANPTLNINSFNLPPKFNGVEKLDFSLQFDSPHIRVDAVNIGGTTTGISTAALDPEFRQENGAIWTGVMISGTDIVLSPGVTVGTIRAAPIRTSVNSSEILNLVYNGQMLFNKSTPGGSATNLTVPDATTYPGNSANGMGNPDRLTFEVRWTNSDNKPVIDADYINGYLLPAGAFGEFLLNRKPVVDSAGKANGAAGFNPASVNPVFWTWYQPQITLRNNYV
ncbi:hypothetical protein Q765_00145 [Flavobacterium rivuli WB 3.3-2 = DSM 21788]|uniref:Uncharacterized protein n=1 Tax=Flavobacterium rivuli WB 3.3-2 = DSM 21788 TaxID=1121895 RepID=A0A0A2M6U0_9FLAO|nr:hypothetical protein [Flavobacterium rivuli]KGO88367.1 hypothetical protein Q765_00145 [Flavobacterium rivuli WB 3.3-2 = DSM 21788]